MTKLATALPTGERNGLDQLTGALCDNPHLKHLVLAVVDCKAVTTDMDTGEVTPTARILRIEPVSRTDYGTAEALMRRALERRHGSTVLPFDTEAELTLMMAEFARGEFVPEPGDPGVLFGDGDPDTAAESEVPDDE